MRIAKRPRWHYNLLNSLSREEAADENLIIKAWYAAVNLLPPDNLPPSTKSPSKVGPPDERPRPQIVHHQRPLRSRTQTQRPLSIKVDEAAYICRAPGYTLKDADNPS